MHRRKKDPIPLSPSVEVVDAEESEKPVPSEEELSSEFPIEVEDAEDAVDSSDDRSQAIVRYDPLSIYLREISKIPQLSREEEKNLALRYRRDKDLEAAKILIQSNLWLSVKIAREYQNAARNLLDLIQEGNIGLMEAVKNFDPLREVRFPSYAMWWIRAYMVRYLIANFRMVKIGTTQAQRKLFFNLKKEKERLERDGFFPAPKLLAEKLNVRESDIIEMDQRMNAPDLSVHTPLHDDSDGDLLSVLPSNERTAEDILAEQEIRAQLSENLEKFEKILNEKERAIFKERLLAEEKVTLQELSDRFLISKERVRQIEERLMKKLKDYLSENMEQV